MNWGSEKIAVMVIRPCVVEPFHFGLAPTPARQDGGSNSSSSPVVNNLVLKKDFLNFTPQFTEACLIHRKVRVLCFALPVLQRDRSILFYIIVKFFVYFF